MEEKLKIELDNSALDETIAKLERIKALADEVKGSLQASPPKPESLGTMNVIVDGVEQKREIASVHHSQNWRGEVIATTSTPKIGDNEMLATMLHDLVPRIVTIR